MPFERCVELHYPIYLPTVMFRFGESIRDLPESVDIMKVFSGFSERRET
jgi:hypothetical protein